MELISELSSNKIINKGFVKINNCKGFRNEYKSLRHAMVRMFRHISYIHVLSEYNSLYTRVRFKISSKIVILAY